MLPFPLFSIVKTAKDLLTSGITTVDKSMTFPVMLPQDVEQLSLGSLFYLEEQRELRELHAVYPIDGREWYLRARDRAICLGEYPDVYQPPSYMLARFAGSS